MGLAFGRGLVSKRRGFTLIELVVVLAIVGVMLAVAVPNLTRQRERGGVESAVHAFRARVERARSLAAEVGPRIGFANAAAVWNYVGCGALGGNPGFLWISVDAAGNYVVPVDVAINAGTGAITVTCEAGTLQALASANAGSAVTAPAAGTLQFAFSGTGRTVYTPMGAAPYDVFVQMRSTSDNRRAPGFRVLPSGVLCGASIAGNMTLCDLD